MVKYDTPGFLHMVFFWLHEPSQPADSLQLVEGCKQYLSAIPSVLRLEAGVPANTPRTEVDSSYGVGLLVEFADAAGHDLYQTHPDHIEFQQKCGHLWSRVQVYDTILT